MAPAPTACNSTAPLSLTDPAMAPATELGFDFDDTLNNSNEDLPPLAL